MDLSVNNRNHKTHNISFQGVESTYDSNNYRILEFSAPPHKKGESVALQYIKYANNADNKYSEKEIKTILFDDSGIASIDNKVLEAIIRRFNGVAYRYIIGGKPVTDENGNTKIIGGKPVTDGSEKVDINISDKDETAQFNIIKTSKNFGITPKKGTMRHSFIDSDVPPSYYAALQEASPSGRKGKDVNAPPDFNFVRNHFNKLGGTLQGIDYLLTKTRELEPYRYIISNPDIGADSVSSHKYWPENLYQCNDLQTFKDINFHLYERGKGYVADGAFTSQSLQSPLVQHAMKWGKLSPWYRMLKVEDFVKPGVLPDSKKAWDHTGVKIVNNPHEKNYNPDKPIYIQFYDDRLVKNSTIQANKLIEKPDKLPGDHNDDKYYDHYEITSNNDSVYMFSFELTPKDFRQLDEFKNRNHFLLKDLEDKGEKFLTFKNFRIEERHPSSGATYWDGNRDMVKMNLSNSADTEGMENARKYLTGVATYWTELVQSDLILRTAKASSKARNHQRPAAFEVSLNAIAKNNDVDLKEIEKNLGSAYLPTLKQGKGLSAYLSEFPMQSLETSKELSAVFAQPSFNHELLFSENFAARMERAVEDVIDKAIPEGENNPQYKQYVIKTYGSEIIKHIYAAALNKNAISENGTIYPDELKNVTLRAIQMERQVIPDTPEAERKQVIDKIHRGFNKLDHSALDSVANRIREEIKDISLYDFKRADSMVLKSKAGLNWRFDAAKDIGDIDNVRERTKNFSTIWPDVQSFWTGFIGNVRKYNPASYIINELTDMWIIKDINPKTFSDTHFGLPDDKINENLVPMFENDYLVKTGSTTSSNYSAYFHKLSCFVGTNTEKAEDGDNDPKNRAGNVGALRDSIIKFMNANQPDNINLSHSFVENHDKPRVLHTLPLDLQLFHRDTVKGNEYYENLTYKLTESNEYSKISPKAVAVAQIMYEQIQQGKFDEDEKVNAEKQDKLKQALKQLALGQKNSGDKPDFQRSEAFGVTPYEISIKDLFKRAGITDNLDEDVLNFHSSMLSKAMSQQTSLWEMMNAIPGTPTLFNGAEFAQTGWETSNKNIFQANRNPILHFLKDDERYKGHFNKMQAISGMYKLPKLSAIRNGEKIILDITGGSKKEPTRKKICDSFGIWYQNDASDEKNYNCIRDLYRKIKENPEQNLSEIKWSGDKYDKGTCDWVINCLKEKYPELKDKAISNETIKAISNNIIKTFEQKQDGKTLIEIAEETEKPIEFLPIFSYDTKGSQVIQFVTNHNVPKGQLARDAKLDESEYTESISMGEECPYEDGTILRRKVYDKDSAIFTDEKMENADAPQKYIVEKGNIYPAEKLGSGEYKPNKNKKIEINDTVLTFYKE